MIKNKVTMDKWKITVTFCNEYNDQFDPHEQNEKKDSEYRFQLAIENIVQELGVFPEKGDWIRPLYKPDYPLDIGCVNSRDFFVADKIVNFDIE